MKYGLMSYKYTINLGNEIQSIASRRFLPEIDCYVDHEKLNEFDEAEDVKLIMNGFYLDCFDAWPPTRNINPLLISMHFRNNDDIKKVLFSDESKDFLNDFGPVGCRDLHSVDFLNDNGVEAYFSGCLTLTLDSGSKKGYDDEVEDYIVVKLDNPEDVLPFLKGKTDKKIYVINQDFQPDYATAFPGQIGRSLYNFTSYYTVDEKFYLAENLLKVYENAGCVITDRLHCALPSLALKTPVLLFNSRQNQERFNGLNNLLLTSTVKEYKDNYNISDVNNPPENSDEYLGLRKDLIKRCRKFTGHINDSYYTVRSYNELVDKNMLMFSNQAGDTRDYIVNVLKMFEKDQKKIDEQKKIIKKQRKEIEEMKNSNSWKLTHMFKK
jgi:hypothetical protein